MILRLLFWLKLVGTAFSQWINVVLRGPRFVALGGVSPDPDETLSAVIGRMAPAGVASWRAAEWLVDRMFWAIEGGRLGHCRRAAAAHAIDDCRNGETS